MRIGTVWHAGEPTMALAHENKVLSLKGAVSNLVSSTLAARLPATVKELLAFGPEALESVRRAANALEAGAKISQSAIIGGVDEVDLLPPLQPGKLICLAGNYAEHLEEGGTQRAPEKETTNPWLFSKPVSTGLIGPGDTVILPHITDSIDWEVELGIVMGQRAKYVSASEAENYIAGYTIFNDISARKLNLAPHRTQRPMDGFYDWLTGKQMDTHACMGPWVVTSDAIGDPQNLGIKLSVNGQLKQDSSTSRMIFFIPEIVEFVTKVMTLEPGDVIATGTPAGVGATKGDYLSDGDLIEAEIENIGKLPNPVAAENPE
ncbi:MAG: fumarylacetoacetate hydrolase family protein [Deinococcales bacterium]|nr:fumarylacetoacetate hydrolase family protein [Deinococcales bacterium]